MNRLDSPTDSFEEVKNQFFQAIEATSRAGGRAVIIVDAVNQLDQSYMSQSFEWIPTK